MITRTKQKKKAGRPEGKRLMPELYTRIHNILVFSEIEDRDMNAYNITVELQKSVSVTDMTVRKYLADMLTDGSIKAKKKGRCICYTTNKF